MQVFHNDHLTLTATTFALWDLLNKVQGSNTNCETFTSIKLSQNGAPKSFRAMNLRGTYSKQF